MSSTLRRRDVHPNGLIDGRPAGGRAQRQLQRFLVSQAEREEAEVERRLQTSPAPTRPNLIALISPKGGVGKTVSTFVVGNLLAGHLKLRAVAVDANPDFGTLARLAPDGRRSDRTLADLLDDADGLATAAALGRYVSRAPTGLHILAAPHEPDRLGPERYGELAAFLGTFYEVVLLDLGTGVAGPLARFAIERADQLVLVTTPEWVTATIVLDAMSHLRHDRTTVALNKATLNSPAANAIEDRFRAEHLHRAVTIPHDERLATMLDTGTYSLDALDSPTRLAIKRLGVAVAEQLV
jgi:MinD-like ATPase involved in chromosome partitioning or flagellar assembly